MSLLTLLFAATTTTWFVEEAPWHRNWGPWERDQQTSRGDAKAKETYQGDRWNQKGSRQRQWLAIMETLDRLLPFPSDIF